MSTEKYSVNDWIKSLVEKESKRDPPAMEGAEEAVDEIIRNIRKARTHYANEERRTQMEIDLVTDQIASERKTNEMLVEKNRQLDEKIAELKHKEEELDRRNIAPTLAKLRKEFFEKNVPLTAQLKKFAQTEVIQAEINAICDEAGVAVCKSSGTYKLFLRDHPSVPFVDVREQENFEDTKNLILDAIMTLTSSLADDTTMEHMEQRDITNYAMDTMEQSAVTEGPSEMTEISSVMSLVPYTDSSMTETGSDC